MADFSGGTGYLLQALGSLVGAPNGAWAPDATGQPFWRVGGVTVEVAFIEDLAAVAISGSYTDLLNVPATFPPAAHTHTLAEITDAGTMAAESATAYAALAEHEIIAGNWKFDGVLIFSVAAQDYELRADGQHLELRGQSPAQGAELELAAFDNDGTDNVLYSVDPIGSPSTTDFEIMEWGWDAANQRYEIRVRSQGSGSLRSMVLAMGAVDALTIDTSGHIAVSGTVDGRDLAADGSKLDGIEAGATADQTAAEIEAAYNAQVAAASQAEMEAGTETAIRRMSPLRVAQAISAQAGSGSGVAVVSVASIDDPSPELSTRSEAAEGTLVLCLQTSGQSTLYQWVSASTVDGAYVVAGSSGYYEAIAGHFIHSDGNVLRNHGLWLDEPTGLAALNGYSIGFAPAGGGGSQFGIQPDGLHFNTAHILDVSSTAGMTLQAGKTLTIGGHAVDDIKVAADAASSGDDELITAGYWNARLASQSDQETATSTTQMVTPGVQQYHPSAGKAWVNFNGTGTIAINADYGVSSLTDNGTGDYTVNWSTSFSSVNYVATGSAKFDSTGVNGEIPTFGIYRASGNPATGSVRVSVGYYQAGDFTSWQQFDCEGVNVLAHGDM